jgi:lipopolysaccharide/colanic/teichoic acid biosynthesis glycosyltransferase
MKRLFDVLLSLSGIILSSPLWLLVAAALKVQDGGPVFYGQTRVGRGGRVFTAFKFRSMITNAEDGVGAVQAARDDPRVTNVGRVLRASALDELPQLVNILRCARTKSSRERAGRCRSPRFPAMLSASPSAPA